MKMASIEINNVPDDDYPDIFVFPHNDICTNRRYKIVQYLVNS